MEEKRRLNADIPGSIAELQAAMKEFLLRHRLYRILLRGKGLEFETFRNYAPDDDATAIDWKASKRSNNLMVKQYRDERNLKVVFIVDVGENMVMGSQKRLKCEYASEVVGAFSHLIITTGDRVGYILFSDKVKDFVKPSGGTMHFHRFVDTLMTASTYQGASDVNAGIIYALDYLKSNIDSVVIVSDFTSLTEKSKKNLTLLASRFETVVVSVRDPLDYTLPDFTGEVVIQDPNTGQQLLVNPKIARQAYEKLAMEREEILRKVCLKSDIDLLELSTDQPFVPSLSAFLKGRLRKKDGVRQ